VNAHTRIKVCCIATLAEAQTAIALGADALGLVSAMPSGPGPIPESAIAEITPAVPPSVATFLLTSLQSTDEIIAQQRRCRTNTVQLCDRLGDGDHAVLREAMPGVSLVQVVHVSDAQAVDEARAVAPHVDAVLLDSGRPEAAVKEIGGTGRVHDWSISRRIVETAGVPVFLAGGLNPDNVGEAIRAAGPFAVDLCSGVRTGGALDAAKLARFVRAVAARLGG
jgi:phosphoribosylanthranilate isomerase